MHVAARWSIPLGLVAASLAVIAVRPHEGAGVRVRKSAEIEPEWGATSCFPDACDAEHHRVHEAGLAKLPSRGDPGVIDDDTWRRCVDACGLYGRDGSCGMPAALTAIVWLLGRGASDAVP